MVAALPERLARNAGQRLWARLAITEVEEQLVCSRELKIRDSGRCCGQTTPVPNIKAECVQSSLKLQSDSFTPEETRNSSVRLKQFIPVIPVPSNIKTILKAETTGVTRSPGRPGTNEPESKSCALRQSLAVCGTATAGTTTTTAGACNPTCNQLTKPLNPKPYTPKP